MKRYLLTVTVPADIFRAYWYGTGEALSAVLGTDGRTAYVVDYGPDQYRCQYQSDRFASGLYFAQVTALDVPTGLTYEEEQSRKRLYCSEADLTF